MRRRAFLASLPIVAAASCGAADHVLLGRRRVVVPGDFWDGILLKNESTDFDGETNGASVNTWSDLSGNEHDWTYDNAAPVVDQTNTLNSHATVKFTASSGTRMLQASNWLGTYTGLEMMVVYKMDPYPPTGTGGNLGCMVAFTNGPNLNAHAPYSDEVFYEHFGRTTRATMGTPTNKPSGWLLYDVASMANGTAYTAWSDLEQFYNVTSGYTYTAANSYGSYSIGGVYAASSWNYFTGWIAAIYLWGRRLSSSERTDARNYIKDLWALSNL